MKRYVEIVLDVALAIVNYYFLGWIGLAIWVVILLCWFGTQFLSNQRIIMQTLICRLPDRCGYCHREIVDEGGVLDHDSIYHAACSDKLESLEELRREAGVPRSQSIHLPRTKAE